MTVRRKHLGWLALVAVALFIIANPLGDNHHGLGKHNAFLATVGQGTFLLSLATALVLIVATIVALGQSVRRSHAHG